MLFVDSRIEWNGQHFGRCIEGEVEVFRVKNVSTQSRNREKDTISKVKKYRLFVWI